MTNDAGNVRQFFKELQETAPVRVKYKQEINGRANCQLSDVEEGALAQNIKGNGNIQIVCKEFKLIAEQPIVLQFNQADGSLTLKSLTQNIGQMRLCPGESLGLALTGDAPAPAALEHGDDPKIPE